jgi:hypothetical protein
MKSDPEFFETLIDVLSNVSGLHDLPEWIPCTDCDLLRDLPTKSERLRCLRKAKTEITRRYLQERIDEIVATAKKIASVWEDEEITSVWEVDEKEENEGEIASAWEAEDRETRAELLVRDFVMDLTRYKNLTSSERQKWIDRATLAACGRGSKDAATKEPVIYFISTDDDLIKIGHTTNLNTRLRSLRTAHPKELRILLVLPGSREDERELHRRFAAFELVENGLSGAIRSTTI